MVMLHKLELCFCASFKMRHQHRLHMLHGTLPGGLRAGQRSLRVLGCSAITDATVDTDPYWEVLVRPKERYVLPAVQKKAKNVKAPMKPPVPPVDAVNARGVVDDSNLCVEDTNIQSKEGIDVRPSILPPVDSGVCLAAKREADTDTLTSCSPGFFDWLLMRKVRNLMKDESDERDEILMIENDIVEVAVVLEWLQLSVHGNENYDRNMLEEDEYWARALIANMAALSAKLMKFLRLNQFTLINRYWNALRQKTQEASELRISQKVSNLLRQSVSNVIRQVYFDHLLAHRQQSLQFKEKRREIVNQEYQGRAFFVQEEAQRAAKISDTIHALNLHLWLTYRQLIYLPIEESDVRARALAQQAFIHEELLERETIARHSTLDYTVIRAHQRSEASKKWELWSFIIKSPSPALYYYTKWLLWWKTRITEIKAHKYLLSRYLATLRAHMRMVTRQRRNNQSVEYLMMKSNFTLAASAWQCFRKLLFKAVIRRLLMLTDRGLVQRYSRYWTDYVRKKKAERMKGVFSVQFSVNTTKHTYGLYYRKLYTWHIKQQKWNSLTSDLLSKTRLRHMAVRFDDWLKQTERAQFRIEAQRLLGTMRHRSEMLLMRRAWLVLGYHVNTQHGKRDKRSRQRDRVEVLAAMCRCTLLKSYTAAWRMWHAARARRAARILDAEDTERHAHFIIRKRYFRALCKLKTRRSVNLGSLMKQVAWELMHARYRCWIRWLRRRRRLGEMSLMAALLLREAEAALARRYFKTLLRECTSRTAVGVRSMAARCKAILLGRYYRRLSTYRQVVERWCLLEDQVATLSVIYKRLLLGRYWTMLCNKRLG
eukprot:TRINITY_DN3648_c0_g1_i1.p1 TRINITY_DN3648_c0_g1~~TRINITY_DN3648_c0_g1_i1.p1  ORF type:complete len:826 (+),score=179.16 TRINITY_DN3648_c0_g1_i1:43-2520(+)